MNLEKTAHHSKTRAHHYISQCYLKGFSILDNQFIIPIDIKDQRVSPPSNSKNIGQERDFNRVDFEGIALNYLEDALGHDFEGNVATALRNIENTNRFEGEDRSYIINLMALFAIRNPTRRNHYNNFIEDAGKLGLSMAAQNVGMRVNEHLVTEDLKKAIDEDQYRIILSRNEHIKAELNLFNEILPYFFSRKWILIRAPDDAQFITSDFPVVLFWTNPAKHKHSPGFGLLGTEVHFPLSKKIALIGSFDGINGSQMESRETVALINSNILAHVKRWIFASSQDFYFLNQKGECLYGIQKYWKYLAEL
ncbi:DUF4238 domain-containing protein [Legionella longbeachae]|nr:DUF4238 domain-containing protein [Legionella longbeachae]RZV21068.1 DUF4238 domain-containing protein [Legionella longbeachae]